MLDQEYGSVGTCAKFFNKGEVFAGKITKVVLVDKDGLFVVSNVGSLLEGDDA